MAIAETPIRLPIPPLPRGFRVAGTHAGLKRNPHREDIAWLAVGEGDQRLRPSGQRGRPRREGVHGRGPFAACRPIRWRRLQPGGRDR